ncbi:hypothetical protein [Streptomyces sp. NPDC001435]|jgi:hypothetical protein|uniref:hypothetical protein n=1 Tax=unclassified Streptomyces TaxID=2593676 RepID=UPI0036B4FF39
MLRFRRPRRLRTPHGAVIAGLLACLALFLTQGTATASATAEPWSASYGPASTAGTWWYQYVDGSSPDRWDVVFDGQLTNTDSECYSTWFAVVYDMSPPVYTKAGTRCGAGTAPVHYSFPSYGWSWTTNVYVTVCKGTTTHTDCAPLKWISTVWT